MCGLSAKICWNISFVNTRLIFVLPTVAARASCSPCNRAIGQRMVYESIGHGIDWNSHLYTNYSAACHSGVESFSHSYPTSCLRSPGSFQQTRSSQVAGSVPHHHWRWRQRGLQAGRHEEPRIPPPSAPLSPQGRHILPSRHCVSQKAFISLITHRWP